MKKILSSILVIILFIALMGVNVFAGNGPMPAVTNEYGTWDEAYIKFLHLENDGTVKWEHGIDSEGYEYWYPVADVVYELSTAKGEMSGAVYNKATNTLTITNVQTDMILEANLMGDDFKLNVIGTNKIGKINVWGYGYGGSLTITGNGTLIVNEKKQQDSAILLNAEGSNSSLKISNTVNVNLYAKEHIIEVWNTKASNNGILLENGQSANVTKSQYAEMDSKSTKGFILENDKKSLIKMSNTNNPGVIYGGQEVRRYSTGEDPEDPNAGTQGYDICELTYISEYESYFNLDERTTFVPEVNFTASGYAIERDSENDEVMISNCYSEATNYATYELRNGNNQNEYIAYCEYYNGDISNEVVARVGDKIAGSENLHAFIPADDVSLSELQMITVEIPVENRWNYILKGTSLIYKAGQAHTHTFDGGVVTKKATFTADGVKTYTCTSKDATKTEAIAKVSNVRLDKTSYTYDGKAKKPSVTVKDSKGKVLKNGTDYTVSYPSGRKNVGKYKVKVTLKGNYTGSKDLEFTIKPKGTSLSKLTAGKKQFKATWKTQKTQTTGYELQYAKNSDFSSGKKTVNIKKNKTTSETVKKLKAKKKYYVRIRTYKTVSGKKICSGWSKVKNITTKK